MSELTPEKWNELNEKLQKEMELSEAIHESQRSIARNLFLVAAVLAVAAVVVFFVLAGNPYVSLIAAAPGFLMAVAVFFALRYQNMAGHTRDDIDRIRRDIRKWKKQKPG